MMTVLTTLSSSKSRLITVRVGRAPEPDDRFLLDVEHLSTIKDVEGVSPIRQGSNGDIRMGEADQGFPDDQEEEDEEDAADYSDTSHLRFLHQDEIETDMDCENDSSYKYESADEGDEEYYDTEIPLGFGEMLFVHEDLLRSSSNYFRAALREHWEEGASGSVDLPEVDAKAFAVYVKWLYTGHLYLTGGPDEGLWDLGKYPVPLRNTEELRWVDCYRAGDYLQDADFKDALIDAVVQLYNRTSYLEKRRMPTYFASVYNWTTTTSPHRNFVVDMCVAGFCTFDLVESFIKSANSSGNYKKMVTDLLMAYAKTVIEEKPTDPWTLEDMCKYHEHAADGGRCYREKRGKVQVH